MELAPPAEGEEGGAAAVEGSEVAACPLSPSMRPGSMRKKRVAQAATIPLAVAVAMVKVGGVEAWHCC